MPANPSSETSLKIVSLSAGSGGGGAPPPRRPPPPLRAGHVMPVCPMTTFRFFACAHAGTPAAAVAASDMARSWLNVLRSSVFSIELSSTCCERPRLFLRARLAEKRERAQLARGHQVHHAILVQINGE